MPPRKTTDYSALFEALIEDLRIQVAASVDRSLRDLSKRLARIERRLDLLDPDHAEEEVTAQARGCTLCDRVAVARGLCSAHYQQWRYRERKVKPRDVQVAPAPVADVVQPDVADALRLIPTLPELSRDN